MKNKGFTLIELLGVIMILAILALITFPPIIEEIKKSKSEIKGTTKVLIIDAAKDYYEDNVNNYELIEGVTYCININTLSEQGYLNKKIKDENLNNISDNKKVKMIYHNNKFDYDVVDSCTYYTVTFDANGGNVDIDSKEVIENSVYGTLPTPTRAGYTFMGWNGKNMINIDAMTNESLINNNDGTYTIWYNTSGRMSKILNVSIVSNTKVVMSYNMVDYNGTEAANNSVKIFGQTADNSEIYITTNGSIKTITKDVKKIRIYQEGAQPVGTYTKFKNLQLEEGETVTPYEPYFIKEDTKMVQNYNHTLKAIWKENE